MNAVNVCRLALAGCFLFGAVGLAQAQELTAKQLEAKGKLETIFSCYPGFEKYTVKEVVALLEVYGAKRDKDKKKYYLYELKHPLTLFGTAKASIVSITEPGGPFYDADLEGVTRKDQLRRKDQMSDEGDEGDRSEGYVDIDDYTKPPSLHSTCTESVM
jgi:hypothetical protein